jgi:hypothetical protein
MNDSTANTIHQTQTTGVHILLVDMHELQIAEPDWSQQENLASRSEMRRKLDDDESKCGQHQPSTVYEPSNAYAEEGTKTQKRKREYGENTNNMNSVDADIIPVSGESEVKSHEDDNSENSPSVLVKHREETESVGSRRIITVKRRGGTYQIENNLFKLFILVSRCR